MSNRGRFYLPLALIFSGGVLIIEVLARLVHQIMSGEGWTTASALGGLATC